MKKFIISGFSDEISSNTTEQFTHLNRLGIEWFEPRGIDGKNISELTLEEAKALKKKMDDFNIRASSLGSPIGKISITDPIEPHLEKLKHVIKITKILDAKNIRIFSFYIPDGDSPVKWRDEVMERMEKMVVIAENEGVKLLHENESKIYGESPENCLDLFKTINSPFLGCVFDPANFTYNGYESYPYAFELLKDYIDYYHIKDAKMCGDIVPAGMGDGGIDKILAEISKTERPYFLSLEPHLGKFEGLKELEADDRLENLPDAGAGTFGIAFNALNKILNSL